MIKYIELKWPIATKTRRLMFFGLIAALFLGGCDKDNGINNNNPYIPIVNFSYTINLSLPLYTNLQYASNHVIINYPSVGYLGVVVFNNGNGYVAYELACPNQSIASCSQMTISGVSAVCACDNASYNLFSGQAQGKKYPLKQYRTQLVNGNLTIYN